MTHDQKIELLLEEKKKLKDRLFRGEVMDKDIRRLNMLILMINEFIIDECRVNRVKTI